MVIIVVEGNIAYQNGFTRKKAVCFLKDFGKCATLLSRKVVLVYISTSSDSEYAPNVIFPNFKITFLFQKKLRKLVLHSFSGDWQS